MTAQLDQALTALEGLDPAALPDAELHELVISTQQAASRFAAVRALLLSAWDARQLWADDGSKAGSGRLARECQLSTRTTKFELARARRLRTMPATLTALQEGKLSIDQADALRWANQPGLEELFARDEIMLISDIATMRLDDARRVIDYWIDAAFQELGKDRPYRDRDGRHLRIARTFGGTVDVRGHLDALAGTEVMTELHRIEQSLSKPTGSQRARSTAPTHYQHCSHGPRRSGWLTLCRSWLATAVPIGKVCTGNPDR